MKRTVGIGIGLSCLIAAPANGQDVLRSWAAQTSAFQGLGRSSPVVQNQLPVTRVSELSDVQPTDWAYQALQNLTEQYNLNLGYPDGTFRGDRALSRDEFAAGLAAALEQLGQRIASGEGIEQEDLTALRALVETFGSDLAEIGDRLDDLATRTTVLEEYQFSPTAQLQGQAVIALTDGTDAQTTLVTRIRLRVNTSFQADDLLVTELEVGNDGLDAIALAQRQGPNLLGTEGILADGGGLEIISVDEAMRLRRLYYSWQPLPDLTVAVGPKLVPQDWIDRSHYADHSNTNFSSSFFQNNPLIIQNPVERAGGAGVALDWHPGEGALAVRSLYVAAEATDPENGGLFDDPYQGSLELEYRIAEDLLLRLQYTHAEINGTTINAGGLYGEWAILPRVALFGRYGMAHYSGENTILQEDLDLSPHTWMIGAAFLNPFIPGSQAGIAIGQPFVEDDLGDANQFNAEAFYNLSISDRFSITPALSLVANPDNEDSETVWQGSLRTVFLF